MTGGEGAVNALRGRDYGDGGGELGSGVCYISSMTKGFLILM